MTKTDRRLLMSAVPPPPPFTQIYQPPLRHDRLRVRNTQPAIDIIPRVVWRGKQNAEQLPIYLSLLFRADSFEICGSTLRVINLQRFRVNYIWTVLIVHLDVGATCVFDPGCEKADGPSLPEIDKDVDAALSCETNLTTKNHIYLSSRPSNLVGFSQVTQVQVFHIQG